MNYNQTNLENHFAGRSESVLINDLLRIAQVYTENNYLSRLFEFLKIVLVSRARILANMAGSFHDPGCSRAIWSAPTLTDMSETIRVNLTEMNVTCGNQSCSEHLLDLEEGFSIEEIDGHLIYNVTVGSFFKLAENLFFRGLHSYSRFDIESENYSPTQELNEMFFLVGKKKNFGFWDSFNMTQSLEERLELFQRIENDLVCSLIFYEEIFGSIETLISAYINRTDPSFSLDSYNPYQEVHPYEEYTTEEQTSSEFPDNGGYAKKKRWADQTVPGSINCTVRGLLPIWQNINCYSVKLLGGKSLLRMLYEDSRNPELKCLDNCNKKLYEEQDYDMNDFVAKFNYIHIYLGCSNKKDKKLYWAVSDLVPEAKGSQKLSELRLSLDYITDNFDGSLCSNSNFEHSNQDIRRLMKKELCQSGELSGGNWNEFAKISLFDFTDRMDSDNITNYFQQLEVGNYSGHYHHHHDHHSQNLSFNGYSDYANDEYQPTELSGFVDQFGQLQTNKYWMRRRPMDGLKDIVFSSVSWRFCKSNGNCSGELWTNCGEECANVKRCGGKREFLGLGVDDYFHDKYNHTIAPPYNVLKSIPFVQPVKHFTTLVSVPGACQDEQTEMTVPMYFLRNYESTKKDCCSMNNCNDILLNDFHHMLEKISVNKGEATIDNKFNIEGALPSALIVGASDRWYYLKEGKSFFNLLENKKATFVLDPNGTPKYRENDLPRQNGNVMRVCHYKREHTHGEHHRDQVAKKRNLSEKDSKEIFKKNVVSSVNGKETIFAERNLQGHSHSSHHPFENGGNNGWVLSQHACGCDNDCIGKSIPQALQTNNTVHEPNNFIEQLEGENLETEIIAKCMQPLGFCQKTDLQYYNEFQESDENNMNLDGGYFGSKQACDYFDDCRNLGEDFFCDNSFLDESGMGFAYCVDKRNNQPTNTACFLPKTTELCKEGYRCSAGDPGCYSDFINYVNYCIEILVDSKGEIRCQFNALRLDLFNPFNNQPSSNNTNVFKEGCFYEHN